MPNFKALTSTLTLTNTNVVVVGGTQGIGAGIAIRCAELGASVLIVGRNAMLGSEMISKLENASRGSGDSHSLTSGARFGFSQRDLSRLEEMRGTVEDIAKWVGKDGVHFLFQSQGGAGTGILAATFDAVKDAFNVQILSHFLIPYLLISLPEPALRNGAQICNIGRPGEKNQTIDFDDFRCLKAAEAGTFSIFRDFFKFTFIMDLFTHEFNLRFPDIHTTHVYPGQVTSAAFEHPTVPWYLKWIVRVLMFIMARSPAEYADVVLWEIASEQAKDLGRTFWDQHGREVDVDARLYTDTDLRRLVWEKLLQLSEAD